MFEISFIFSSSTVYLAKKVKYSLNLNCDIILPIKSNWTIRFDFYSDDMFNAI
jgi:hypothetical protein